ncbi:MAG: MBG domain-containing protein [Verrucomicrobiota bacterium]
MKKHLFLNVTALLLFFSFSASSAFSQVIADRTYGKDHPFTIQELPAGKLKTKLETLSPQSKEKAMQWLHQLTFKAFDAAEHLRVDDNGGVFMICPDGHGKCDGHTHETQTVSESVESAPETTSETPTTQQASVSINSPPAYNSKPGAAHHLYLDFNGAIVAGKAWNTAYGVTSWNCPAWGNDGFSTTFSDSEQAAMKEVWQRMAEDYAPFDINVTTDVSYDPVNYLGNKNNVAWLLFTETTDNNGKACPHDGAGGVAYVGVYGRTDYFSTYQPAWVLPMAPADMAEAGSHEIGHNLGLSHDGNAEEYYGGHGSNDISWGPLMGTGYDRNVSQWSKGDYYNASQKQDDLAIMATKLSYEIDDHETALAFATPLVVTGGTTITSTTPENDPSNSSPQNKGIIEKNTDVDLFSFQTGAGSVTLNVNPWKQPSGTFGGNLDVLMELYDDGGNLLASANPEIQTRATITTILPAGTYYISVKNTGAGNPSNAVPTGYTSYGSIGQYFISGTIQTATPMLRVLSITPNQGDVNTTVSVAITGTLFVATPTVKLKKTGYTDIVATNVVFVDSENLTCDIDLTGAVLGDWNVEVTNPDLETATLPAGFTVELATVDFFEEFFDASLSLPTGWSTYTTTDASPLWEVVSTSSQTPNNSVFAASPSVVATKYLESPSISVPADSINLQFSFWHNLDLESGYDGGTLQFKIDGGEWFDVTSSDSGAAFESNGYNRIISTSYRSPISGQYAWSGDSEGYIQSVVSIVDPTKYAGKTLKARWLLASDNFAVSTGWNIDTVQLTGSIYPPVGGPGANDLVVTAAEDLSFVGSHSGSFTPSSQSYTLTNSGTSSLKWSISKTSSWVTLSTASGTLAAGDSATVTVSINSNVLSLPLGDHSDTLTITNITAGDLTTTRDVLITLNPIPVTVMLAKLAQTYNGTARPVTVTTSPSGVTVQVTYDGSTTVPINAGSYPVVATVTQSGYVGSASGTLVVSKLAPTVSSWPTTASIPLGQAVSSATLSGGSASVSGSFGYNSPGTVLTLGTHSVPVTFTPTDTTNYTTVSGNVNVTVYPPTNLVRTTVSSVSNSGWTPVDLGKTYTSPVIVATPIYPNSSSSLGPVVTRIRNVTASTFELKLDRADGSSAAVSMNVAVVAVDAGVYTVAQHGVKMEAVKYTSTVTASGTGSWVAEARTFQNTYTKPVVVGQVMSYNDTRWSAFWSMGGSRANPVNATNLRVGKHVGLDPVKTRANEQIGYIVIETGTGIMDGVRYRAALGSDTVKSFGDSVNPFIYPLTGLSSVSTAAVSQSGIDGTEGSWAVLSGNPALTTTALKLHVAEDGFYNTLRKHTTEQVAYIVFE